MSTHFHKLTISKIKQETPDAVSLFFTVPDELKDVFQYQQGQYLTLRFMLNGKEERRAYSMCSSPMEEHLAVTVKRVHKGKVSNHIHDQLSEGQTIEVMPPEGRFFTKLDHDQRKTYYLFGAGSGITPLYSILKTILEKEPKSAVHLLYGNRNEDGIIYHDALAELERRYTGQLSVTHILSQPKRAKAKGLGSLFGKGKISWLGPVGRISQQEVNNLLAEYPVLGGGAAYFICGPGAMIDTVETALKNAGVSDDNIHLERFTAGPSDGSAEAAATSDAQVITMLDGRAVTVTVKKGKTVLDALIDAGFDPPYSCTSGACSSCMAKTLEGNFHMEVCHALDDDEIAEGYILTCQAYPTTAAAKIDFEA